MQCERGGIPPLLSHSADQGRAFTRSQPLADRPAPLLAKRDSELLYRDPEFGQFFSGYFRNWLCDHHAYSEDESLQMLGALLEEYSTAART